MKNINFMKKNYIIGAIIVAVVIVIIIVSMIVDHRSDVSAPNMAGMDMNASSTISTVEQASSTPVSSAPATVLASSTSPAKTTLMATTSSINAKDYAVLVMSPNGGESWNIGSVETIAWKVWERSLVYSPFDIYMVPQTGSCIYPMPCARGPVVVAKSVPPTEGLTYDWQVGSAANLPAGSYKARICFAGTDVCDMSDEPFTITMTATSSAACPANYSWSGVECAKN